MSQDLLEPARTSSKEVAANAPAKTTENQSLVLKNCDSAPSRHCVQFFQQQNEQREVRLGFCLKCHEIDQLRTEVRAALLKNDPQALLSIAKQLSSSGMIDMQRFNDLIQSKETQTVKGEKVSPIVLAAALLEMEMLRRKSERFEEFNLTKRAIVSRNDPELMRQFLSDLLEEKIIDDDQYQKLLLKLEAEGVAAVGNDLNEIFYETTQLLGRKIQIAESQVNAGAAPSKGGSRNSFYRSEFINSLFSDLSASRSNQNNMLIISFGANLDTLSSEQKRAKHQLTELCEILREYGKAKQEEEESQKKHAQEQEEDDRQTEKRHVEYVLAHAGHPYSATLQTVLAKLENFSLDYLRLMVRAA